MDTEIRIGTQGRQRTAPADGKRARTGAVWGPRPPWPARRQRHPLCCLPRKGRATDRVKATPRTTGFPSHTVGGNGVQAAPPPPTPPHSPSQERIRRADPPHGERTAPSQVGGKRDRAAPSPQASQTEHGTEAGHLEGHGPRGTALPAASTGTARGAHATPTRGGGGGSGRRESASTHTDTKDTRGIPRGQPDRACGTHRPHGMAYQRARMRDTPTGQPAKHSAGNAGREGENEEDTTPGTGPSPPNRPRAPRTHDQGTATAKAVVERRPTHQPHG